MTKVSRRSATGMPGRSRSSADHVDKVREFYNSPAIIAAMQVEGEALMSRRRSTEGEYHVKFEVSLPSGETVDENLYVYGLTALEDAGADGQKSVLDIGCGLGKTTRAIKERTGDKAEVHGLNIAEKQLEIARAAAAAAGLAIEYRLYSGRPPLPYDDDRFDVLVAQESIIHMADKDAMFAEFARILKPGGILTGNDIFAAEQLSADQRQAHIVPIEQAYDAKLLSLRNYQDLLEAAGFQDCRMEDARDIAVATSLDDSMGFRDPALAAEDPNLRHPALTAQLLAENRNRYAAIALAAAYSNKTFTVGVFFGRKGPTP